MVKGEGKMTLSNEDVGNQIEHMTKFIEQEAIEKATEVDAKGEEEFNIEKGKMVQQSRLKIMEFYEKKEKAVELNRKIQTSNFFNQVRLKALKAREDHMTQVLIDAREHLGSVTEDRERYAKVLGSLIQQGLLQLLETEVTIKVREVDVGLAESVLPTVLEDYAGFTGKTCDIYIEDKYLSPKSCGGVILKSHVDRMKIENTLEARLGLVARQVIPEMRNYIFGKNPNRKFFD